MLTVTLNASSRAFTIKSSTLRDPRCDGPRIVESRVGKDREKLVIADTSCHVRGSKARGRGVPLQRDLTNRVFQQSTLAYNELRSGDRDGGGDGVGRPRDSRENANIEVESLESDPQQLSGTRPKGGIGSARHRDQPVDDGFAAREAP